MSHARLFAVPIAVALLAAGCLDFFKEETPEGPNEVVLPRTVSVTIEYTQPAGCVNVDTPCDDESVVFFASWMRPDQAIVLTPDPRTFVWRGVGRGVPVNYPPRRDEPYRVWVFDPHFREAPTLGGTAERLKVGGEMMKRFATSPGVPFEAGLVFIDESGLGHSPF
jgi:hypothetical protein